MEAHCRSWNYIGVKDVSVLGNKSIKALCDHHHFHNPKYSSSQHSLDTTLNICNKKRAVEDDLALSISSIDHLESSRATSQSSTPPFHAMTPMAS